MSTANNPIHAASARVSSALNFLPPESSYMNGDSQNQLESGLAQRSGAANMPKKGKQKKATDPNEASKLIAAKISQLELGKAEEKDQEAEIEREVKKASRELNSLTSKMDNLQKIETLQKRVTEHLADMKRLERENIKNKKRGDLLQKEKDHGRSELSKAISLREKIEKLCRELQRDNNKLKAENKTMSDAAKSNHDAWDEKFRQLLWQLQDCQDVKDHPQAQVMDVGVEELFRTRFKSLIDQYELRELHFHSLLRSKELEVQFNLARYDRERKTLEIEQAKSKALNSQVQTFSRTETELRNQLNIYVEKFKQVEDTLNNSNDLFLTFRKEMEEMSKKTKRLEKENLTLTRKQDLTNRNILEMAEERTKTKLEIEALKKKNEKLTSIINQMQKQGRGMINGMLALPQDRGTRDYVEGDHEGTESEFDEFGDEPDDGDADDGSDGGEYDEDTEDETHAYAGKQFGPEPPPSSTQPTQGAIAMNGISIAHQP